MNDTNGVANWKLAVTSAALRQGPSFLLLLLVLYGIWEAGHYVATVGVPAHLEQIKAGYREIQESHDRNLSRVVAAFEQEQVRTRAIVDAVERLVENKKLLEESRALLLRLVEERQVRQSVSP